VILYYDNLKCANTNDRKVVIYIYEINSTLHVHLTDHFMDLNKIIFV